MHRVDAVCKRECISICRPDNVDFDRLLVGGSLCFIYLFIHFSLSADLYSLLLLLFGIELRRGDFSVASAFIFVSFFSGTLGRDGASSVLLLIDSWPCAAAAVATSVSMMERTNGVIASSSSLSHYVIVCTDKKRSVAFALLSRPFSFCQTPASVESLRLRGKMDRFYVSSRIIHSIKRVSVAILHCARDVTCVCITTRVRRPFVVVVVVVSVPFPSSFQWCHFQFASNIKQNKQREGKKHQRNHFSCFLLKCPIVLGLLLLPFTRWTFPFHHISSSSSNTRTSCCLIPPVSNGASPYFSPIPAAVHIGYVPIVVRLFICKTKHKTETLFY